MATGLDKATWLALRDTYGEALRRGQLRRYRKRRWDQALEFAAWLSEKALLSMSVDRALTLYRASGSNRTAEFETNPIEEVRDSLDFLLYDTIKLEGRFSECASDGGAYKLVGAGKEFVSYLMCLRDPTLFAVWNRPAEGALKLLGMYPATLRNGDLGLGYLDLLEVLQRVRRQLGLAHFRAVDEVCYLVSQQGKLGIKYGSAL